MGLSWYFYSVLNLLLHCSLVTEFLCVIELVFLFSALLDGLLLHCSLVKEFLCVIELVLLFST